MNSAISKALTFRASSIGDSLMGKYVLENVHAAFPDARCAIVIGSRGPMIRDVLAAYPWLEVREANRRSRKSVIDLWRDFHGAEFVQTQYAGKPGGRFNLMSKIAAWLIARRGRLVGFRDASRLTPLIYSHLVPFDITMAPAEHERRALAMLGVPLAFPYPKLNFVRNDTRLLYFEVERKKYLVVHLFAGNATRSFSPSKQKEVLAGVARQFPGFALLVSGGAQNADEARAAAEGLSRVRVIAGEASLQDLLNLIDQSAGVVSIDTGVAHMTAQLGRPLVVLATCLGPNWWEPRQYGPDAPITFLNRDDLCMHGHVHKHYPDCLNEIRIDDIRAAAAKRFEM